MAPAARRAAGGGIGPLFLDAEAIPMTDAGVKPTPAKAWRRVKDYIVPPIAVPVALSIALLIYMLVRGPA